MERRKQQAVKNERNRDAGVKGEKKISWGYILSFLRWASWIAVFCAVVLLFEVAAGYISITGKEENPAFVVFFIVMIGALSLARPEIPYILAVFAMPLATMAFPGIDFLRGGMADMEIVHPLILGAILGLAFRGMRRGAPLFEGNLLTLPLFLYLGWSALSYTWCYFPRLANYNIQDILFGVLIYLASVKIIRSRAMLEKVVGAWILSGIFLTGLGLYFIMTGAAARVGAMSENPNVFSLEMNLVIMLVVAMLYIRERTFLPPGILWALLISMFLVNLGTGSRAGFFSLIAALIYFLFNYHFLNRDKKHISLVMFFAIVLLAGVIFIVALDPLEGLRIGSRGYNPTEFAEENTFQFRLEMWALAWEYIRATGRYVQGLGAQSFIGLTRIKYEPVNHPHSIYVYVGVHYGIVGLALFLWIIVALVRQLRAGLREARSRYYQVLLRAMGAALLAFAIHGIVDFDFEHRRTVWLYVGVAMAAVKLARSDEGRGTKDEGRLKIDD